jgi:carbamoyl-phosphate synthase large subunit
MADDSLGAAIKQPTDERLWAIAEGLRRGWSVDDVHRLCRVDRWFLNKIRLLVRNGLDVPPPNAFKMVDTCAGEFESRTPYYYATNEPFSDA